MTNEYMCGLEQNYLHLCDLTAHRCTGKERDNESGLDNFGARYYGSSMGRFMTPDWAARPTTVPYAIFGDPQSLNLYGYVRNDPITRADADGHIDCSGKNAQGVGCQAIAAWNTLHGIATAVKDSFYVKTEAGFGLKAQVKGGPVKVELGLKSIRETKAEFNNEGTVKMVNEASAKIKAGKVSIGPSISKEQTIQIGDGPRNYSAPSEVHGNFLYDLGEHTSGSNWEVGIGAGLFVGVGGSIEVGIDAKELVRGIEKQLDPTPQIGQQQE